MAIERIVVGVDGSDGAQHALDWSADLALKMGSEIFAVCVVPQSWLLTLNAFQVKDDDLFKTMRAKLVTDWTASLRDAGVNYTPDCLQGDPAAELLRIAHERHADLIVIGGTHHGSVRGSLIGGTAHHIVNRSPIPVLVVPKLVEEGQTGWGPLPG